MEIKNKYSMKKIKVGDLQMMSAFLVWDEINYETSIIITDISGGAVKLSNASNCRELICFRLTAHDAVSVIGRIRNLDIINLDLEELK